MFKGTRIDEILGKVKMPPKGGRAEKQSFMLQNAKFMELRDSRSRIDKVDPDIIEEVAQLYVGTKVPTFLVTWNTPEWEDAFEQSFSKALGDMATDKTPGALWNSLGSDNGAVLGSHPELVLEQTRQLCEKCLKDDFDRLTAAEMFVRTGVAYKVFVKSEPHKVAKLNEGRQRLVFASPLHMTILERMIFGRQNDADIDNWEHVPSKPGLTMNGDGAWTLRGNVESFLQPLSTDQEGWDWHVPDWLMFADVEVRRCLLEGSELDINSWHRVARNMTHLLARKTVLFSDGTFFVQSDDNAGVWPSGSYRTSGTNSRMRVLIRRIACGNCKIITMGDDAVEDNVENIQDCYASYGFVLKPPEFVSKDKFEFCSKFFELGVVRPVPTSVDKMVAKLIRSKSIQAQDAIWRELENAPERVELDDLGLFTQQWF